jgi:four helix bundle protein
MENLGIKDFRNLQVWEEARSLTLKFHWASSRFPQDQPQGLSVRVRNACISLWAHIADGCAGKDVNESIQCIKTSMDMAAELDSLLQVSEELNYLENDEYTDLRRNLVEVKRMLSILLEKFTGQKKLEAKS